MSTLIRPELSTKNPYWIEKHRYYELKHFCLQYPIWKKHYLTLSSLPKQSNYLMQISSQHSFSDPTFDCAAERIFYSDRMQMIEKIALETDEVLAKYILEAVTTGHSYDYFKSKLEIPCCKDTYYDLYRRFFYLLNKERM